MAEHGAVSMMSDKHMSWTSIEFAPDLLCDDSPPSMDATARG